MDAKSRFFLAQDDDGHWYMIDVDYMTQWAAWIDQLDSEDPDWDVPDYAISVGGSPSLVTFQFPEFK